MLQITGNFQHTQLASSVVTELCGLYDIKLWNYMVTFRRCRTAANRINFVTVSTICLPATVSRPLTHYISHETLHLNRLIHRF
jgi:hypothetical protein